MVKDNIARGRPPGGSGAATLQSIRLAGTKLLYEQGYDGMSLRDLAATVGIQVASLYNHIEGKQAFLSALLHDYTVAMLQGLDPALEGSHTPVERLRAFVDYHISFHTERLREASICLSELRHLQGEERKVVQQLRDSYENRLRAIVQDGIETGAFRAIDPRLAVFAILGMLTGVISWYQPGGRCTRNEIIDAYTDLALAALLAKRD